MIEGFGSRVRTRKGPCLDRKPVELRDLSTRVNWWSPRVPSKHARGAKRHAESDADAFALLGEPERGGHGAGGCP